ncbi:MAG TPA: BrnT family toxin [Pyrinomonadaceae bacterium]|nr:BrnT family toxin [Pyrinomonadaceae bacterium]
MRFEWDDQKAAENIAKHRVSFGEATEVFYDPNAVELEDTAHSVNEARFVIIGYSTNRMLYVVFAERVSNVIRIISRGRRRRQKERYMKNNKDKKSESRAQEVELVVTQDDYEAGLKRGWTDDDMLKPGRYKFKRGGFLERHPELKVREKKRA